MKAIRVHQYGGPEHMEFDEVEKPVAQADEVLIRVSAAGVNYADLMLRQGVYLIHPPTPFIPGFEVAGIIEAVGAEVTNRKPGQRVMAWVETGGGYAEFIAAKAGRVVPIPDGMTDGVATALLVQGITALGLLREVKAGQTMLIHAAAGGVGSLLVQLAKLRGARVIGTASSREKLETVKGLGADVVINYTKSDWAEQVLKATNNEGVDHLIEMVGGEIGAKNLSLLKSQGVMTVYGFASGEDFQISAQGLLFRAATVKGYIVYNESPQTLAQFTEELMNHVAAGRLKVIVQSFALADAVKAHEAVGSRQTTGKVILAVR
ncbi:MAG: quinone oxidoreductase [Blastocatellia bacterium]